MSGLPEEHRAILQRIVDQQDYAYRRPPTGTWAQRHIPGVCKHEFVRCTHGDEIIGRHWRRRVCLDCGRALRGRLPEECFFTGETHDRCM